MLDCAIARGCPAPGGRLISGLADDLADGWPVAAGPVPPICRDLLELLAGVSDGRPGQGRDHPVGGGAGASRRRGRGRRFPVVHRDRRDDDTPLIPVRVDGKTVRGARNTDGSQVHLLAALAGARGVVAAQTEVGAKTNEIPMIIPLLDGLDLARTVLTADALHTQRATADYVHGRGADFAFPVKDNQPGLFDALDALHWRDTLYREDDSAVRTRSGHRAMAALRNLAIGALHQAGRHDTTEATRWASRYMHRPFTILGLTS